MILLAMLFAQALQAQITLGVGYEQDGFDREGLNSFIRSYNDYFGANIIEPLKEIKAFRLPKKADN